MFHYSMLFNDLIVLKKYEHANITLAIHHDIKEYLKRII